MAQSLVFFLSIACAHMTGAIAASRFLPRRVAAAADPTDGFTEVSLNESNFRINSPYDLPASSRYTFSNNIHNFSLYSTDKPLAPSSPTNPRSEVRVLGYDYEKGVWQFEGNLWVRKGTEGVCVMQVFGAVGHPTTLMLQVRDNSLRYYGDISLYEDIAEKWLRINVIHDADQRWCKIFVNGSPVKEVPNRTDTTHWFQFGLYLQENGTAAPEYMNSLWKGVRVLKKT